MLKLKHTALFFGLCFSMGAHALELNNTLLLSFRADDGRVKDCARLELDKVNSLRVNSDRSMTLRGGPRVMALHKTIVDAIPTLIGSVGVMPLKDNDSMYYSHMTYSILNTEEFSGRLKWHQVRAQEDKNGQYLDQYFCDADFRVHHLNSDDLVKGIMKLFGTMQLLGPNQ